MNKKNFARMTDEIKELIEAGKDKAGTFSSLAKIISSPDEKVSTALLCYWKKDGKHIWRSALIKLRKYCVSKAGKNAFVARKRTKRGFRKFINEKH